MHKNRKPIFGVGINDHHQSVGLSFEEVLQHNVGKLSVRYSSGSYSNKQAQERADKV